MSYSNIVPIGAKIAEKEYARKKATIMGEIERLEVEIRSCFLAIEDRQSRVLGLAEILQMLEQMRGDTQ